MRARTLILVALIVAAAALLARSYPGARLEIPPSTIKFSHELHVTDMEVECLTCHEAASTSTQSSDVLLPTMDVCGGCHDVEDDETCATCHVNDNYDAFTNPKRPIAFNHKLHVGKGVECARCHGDIAKSARATEAANMPKMATCFECHDGITADADCAMCHNGQITLSDIHPVGWLHQHSERAVIEPEWCSNCHRDESFCVDCHRGDNVTGNIHDLNYTFTHGLDANSKERDCSRCHDRQTFCVECHEGENRIPLLHSSLGWVPNHGKIAREDVENCASCHDTGDPTCARSGCHADLDGIRGTDNPIHDPNAGLFEGHGIWHNDDGAFCFDCHTNTHTPGVGFCGYCHGAEGD